MAVSEDALNRCIQRLRRLSESECASDFVIETVPRIGFRLVRTAATADAEPETSAPTEPVPPAAPPPAHPSPATPPRARRNRRRLWAGGVALAAIASALAGFVLLGPALKPASPLFAIEPFADADADAATRSVADTLADDVSAALEAAGLKLASTAHPAFRSTFGGRNAFVLRGRVTREGDGLTASTMLARAGDPTVLWTKSVSQEAGSGAALGHQAAAKTADVLVCAFKNTRTAQRWLDAPLLTLLLKACDELRDLNTAEQTADTLRQAVGLRPDFARAWAMLAMSDVLSFEKLPPAQADAARAEARRSAELALRLDPHEGEAYTALSLLLPDDALIEKDRILARGLKAAPDDPVLLNFTASQRVRTGFLGEALAYFRRSAELDPLSPVKAAALATAEGDAGEMLAAREIWDKVARDWGRHLVTRNLRIAFEAQVGDPNRALALLDDPATRSSGLKTSFIDRLRRLIVVRRAGTPAARRAFGEALMGDIASGRVEAVAAVQDLASVGDVDGAFRAAALSRAPLSTNVLFSPALRGLRSDPRFMGLAARSGLVSYWRTVKRRPDFCSDPGMAAACRDRLEQGRRPMPGGRP